MVPFVKWRGKEHECRHVKQEIDAGGALVGGLGEYDLERLAALVLRRVAVTVCNVASGGFMQAVRTWSLRAARGHGDRQGHGNG